MKPNTIVWWEGAHVPDCMRRCLKRRVHAQRSHDSRAATTPGRSHRDSSQVRDRLAPTHFWVSEPVSPDMPSASLCLSASSPGLLLGTSGRRSWGSGALWICSVSNRCDRPLAGDRAPWELSPHARDLPSGTSAPSACLRASAGSERSWQAPPVGQARALQSRPRQHTPRPTPQSHPDHVRQRAGW